MHSCSSPFAAASVGMDALFAPIKTAASRLLENRQAVVLATFGAAAVLLTYLASETGQAKMEKARLRVRASLHHYMGRQPLIVAGKPETVTPSLLSSIFHQESVIPTDVLVTAIEVKNLSDNRGLRGFICRLNLTYSKAVEGAPASIIYKSNSTGTVAQRMQALACKTAVEGLAYKELGSFFPPGSLPSVYYVAADSSSGDCVVLMEDLSKDYLGANFLTGNQIWGMPKDLQVPVPAETGLAAMFSFAAEMHGRSWGKAPELLQQFPWMKGADWYRGKGAVHWNHSMRAARMAWQARAALLSSEGKKLTAAGTEALEKEGDEVAVVEHNGMKWSPKLISILHESFARSTWSALQEHLQSKDVPAVLTHGDFHTANFWWRKSTGQREVEQQAAAAAATGQAKAYIYGSSLKSVDLSEVGIWEPAADLGQTIISDVKRQVWQAHDRKLLRECYWERLTAPKEEGGGGVSAASYPWERCWADYCRAPVERWLWVFAVLLSFPLPAIALQYFHDQIVGFIEDHCPQQHFFVLKPVVHMPF